MSTQEDRMDYCSSCRRHLNGALVCPGCGAYAPDIAPATADGRTVPAPAIMATTGTAAAWESTAPSDTLYDGRLHAMADEAAVEAGMSDAPQTAPPGDLVAVPSAPQGRAARRRQRARWKKNQRRAVVATAVALVGGGLTVAAMDWQPGDRAQAATAPNGAGPEEEQSARHSRPTSTRPGTHPSSPTSPAQPPLPDLARRQHAAAPPRTTPPSAQPDAAAPARTTPTSAPQPQTASPASGGTVPDRPEAATTQTPAPAATDGKNSADGTNGTEPGTSQPSPAPATTAPSQICLLVVCLG
ncbi:SCO2400 family protein [Streptomyces sp. 2A115]|uniref:SCO2400 family protein n=1 Tax=Streptomyces sp. 2A115 TaxID=3457439 RepID=UPI003FD4258A